MRGIECRLGSDPVEVIQRLSGRVGHEVGIVPRDESRRDYRPDEA